MRKKAFTAAMMLTITMIWLVCATPFLLVGAQTSSADSTTNMCPKRSDVVFTSREQHINPVPASSGYTTWTAAKAFNATRLDWIYTRNASCIQEAHRRGLSVVTTAMNANLPDQTNLTTAEGATYIVGRIVNIHGEKLTAPWMREWSTLPYYGCINNPDYLNVAFETAINLLEIGSDAIQHDDPATNGEAVTWNNGDPTESGCYCDHCMHGFTDALVTNLPPAQQHALNITKTFNYRDFLLGGSSNNTNVTKGLRDLFISFQRNSTEKYVTNLRAQLDAKSHSMGRPLVTLSCNNGGRWSTPYYMFDYGMGELSKSLATPDSLKALFVDGVPEGKQQVLTMPKEAVISDEDIYLIRWAIAYSYAVGGNMMTPWDIYLPTPKASRFYGTESQFGDIYRFVTAVGSYLDEAAYAVPETGGNQYTLVYTGKGGDGKRFRRVMDDPPVNGTVFQHEDYNGCVGQCNVDVDCKGIYISSNGECDVLYDLEEIAGTALEGKSYIANRTALPSVVSTNSTGVSVLLRRPSNSSTNQFVSAHIVDWRYATTSGRYFPNVSITINSEVVFGTSGCSTITAIYATLDEQRVTIPVLCTGKEGNQTLNMVVPSPRPWSMIHMMLS